MPVTLWHEKRLRTLGYTAIAGVDEVGRGSLAGPVVAAAVILRSARFPKTLDDSKKVSPPEREAIYRFLLDHADIGVGAISEGAIDHVNIHQATLLAMRQAVGALPRQPQSLLIDGKFTIPSLSVPQWGIVGGDGISASIAAASIVAKVVRDYMMRILDGFYPHYGFRRHKGYGTRFHFEALRVHGPSLTHRKSFSPIALF